jgi:hypothetical protein
LLRLVASLPGSKLNRTLYRSYKKCSCQLRLNTQSSGEPNAAPEWQAGTLHRKQRIDGGMATRGACYPFLYDVTLLWSAS